jgi:phosphoserine phosphatase
MSNTIRNNSESPALIASDLNGTLTTGSPVLAVYRWLKINQPESLPPLFKARILISYLQVKIGLKKIDTWGKQAMGAVLALVQNPDPNLLETLMDFVVDDELWPKRRPEPISYLREALDQGAELVVISAAFQPAVIKFARKIAPENTFGIGTPVAIEADGLSLKGPFNSRERKLSSLLEVIGSRPVDTALGDTFADIPLLEKAHKALAIHPDRKLRRAAEKHGWRIVA